MQRVLYRARTGVKLGATGAPDREEARALFLAWEELGPLLDYVPEDGDWQAVVAMRDLLRELYTDKPPRGDLRAAEVARAYRAHCCKEACQSNYLVYLEEDVTEAVANARRLRVGLGQAVAPGQGCGLRGGHCATVLAQPRPIYDPGCQPSYEGLVPQSRAAKSATTAATAAKPEAQAAPMASAAAPVAPVEAPSAAALFREAMGAVQADGVNRSFEVCVLRACIDF